MPLFDYCCGTHTTEILFWPSEEIPDEVKCSECGETALKMLAMPAKTPGRWGDQTGKYGVDGFYDRGLGARYHTSMERERIMDAKGLASLSDFNDDDVERGLAKQAERDARHDRNIAAYKRRIEETGDKARAVADVFSLKAMREAGTLDDDGVNDAC